MLIGVDASRTTVARRTGTEAYSLALTRALLELGTAHSWRLYFNRPPQPGAWPSRPGLDLRIIPWPRLWTHMRLSLEMARQPPDLLFVPAHVLPLITPKRSVVTVHDLGYRHFPDAHTRRDRLYLDLSTRRNARVATLVLADSAATRDDLVSLYGTPAEKIRVVYPGRNEGLQRVEDPAKIAAVIRHMGIARPYILFVGTLQPRKNLLRLIEAYAQLIAGWEVPGQAPLLVLAGKRGWLSEGIFEGVARCGLEGQVRFVDYVQGSDLPALISGASLFVYPSLYEGFGFPVLEAMACDVPVVCSNNSSLPEVAGDAAVLVDPLDVAALAHAMRVALTDDGLRHKLVEAGRHQITRFSWHRAAREALAVFDEACR